MICTLNLYIVCAGDGHTHADSVVSSACVCVCASVHGDGAPQTYVDIVHCYVCPAARCRQCVVVVRANTYLFKTVDYFSNSVQLFTSLSITPSLLVLRLISRLWITINACG